MMEVGETKMAVSDMERIKI